MEGASENPGKEKDGAKDPESEDFEKGYSAPATDGSIGAPEDSMTIPDFGSNTETELEEITEGPDAETDFDGHSGRMKSRTSMSPESSSHEESQAGKPDDMPGPAIITLEKVTEPPAEEEPASEDTTTPLPSTGRKGHPTILGGVRREDSSMYKSGREALDSMAADMLQKSFRVSVSMQTDSSWLYDHSSKKKSKKKLKEDRYPLENDIYAVLSQDLSSLDILCDTEFKEEFIKLFQESLKTLSSVGPPTILAYRRELSRGDIEIGFEEEYPAYCEFCGSLLRHFPSFGSLEQMEEYAPLFCCQRFRDLQEFLVTEKERLAKTGVELINIAPHQAHGSEAERKLARERARKRMRDRQMAKQLSFLIVQQEKEFSPVHSTPEYTKQLKTISYIMSQDPPSSSSWTTVPIVTDEQRGSEEITYSISSCDFTIAGGKLLKNQFLQQYYKNGVKFLTMFPDGTAQIFYPSGNLAVIIIQKKKNSGYICVVQEDSSENADIQAVFESSGQGTCYHPNGIIWINITIRGGHYSDQVGNKVRTWIWPNHLQKETPTVSFKPVFASLNQNVGIRILGQDKVAISFLAMGKQAKINVGTKVEPSTDHHPWPKHVSEDDLVLFASRIKILKVLAKLHGCLEFSSSNQWTKIQLPSYISKQALKLMNLCRESAVSAVLDNLITSIINVTA